MPDDLTAQVREALACPDCGGRGGWSGYDTRQQIDVDVECERCGGTGLRTTNLPAAVARALEAHHKAWWDALHAATCGDPPEPPTFDTALAKLREAPDA